MIRLQLYRETLLRAVIPVQELAVSCITVTQLETYKVYSKLISVLVLSTDKL